MRRVRAAVALIGLIISSGRAWAEEPAASEKPVVRIVSPASSDMPAGETRFEAGVVGALPGDVVDFFVDGRKIGSASAAPWAVNWAAGDALRAHAVSVVLVRGGQEVASARVRTRDPGFTATADVRAVSHPRS